MSPQYFISYRRSPGRTTGDAEAIRLRDALRDRGVRSWRDIDNLGAEPTEAELTAVLQDPETAGAVMLVSPEIRESDVVRNVEARRIFQRKAKDPAFLVKPLLLGLNYGEADEVLGSPAGFQDVSNWNLQRVANGEYTLDDACSTARDVLRHRCISIAADGDASELSVGLFSRRIPGIDNVALKFDYSGYFNGRVCPDGTLEIIEQAMLDAATSIAENIPTRSILGEGQASLPIGLLFGAVFSPLAGFALTWRQAFGGRDPERWSHAVDRSQIGVNVTTTGGDVSAKDIVLALGVSANIEDSVARYLRSTQTPYRVAQHVAPQDGAIAQNVALSPADGVAIVSAAVDAARKQREELGISGGRLHLFLACPLAMAVLLGQKLNTFGDCVLYEHDPSAELNYLQVHTFNPSGFTYTTTS
ncbi:MAG: SAVED domain-containing protein [Pseudomonadota bacterium]